MLRSYYPNTGELFPVCKVLETQVPTVFHHITDDNVLSSPPRAPDRLVAIPWSKDPWGSCQAAGTSSFPLVSAGSQFLELTAEG